MSSPYLGLIHIAAAQNQKEVTANAAFDALDAAIDANNSFALTDSATARTFTQAEMASGFLFILTGALTADRNVVVPAIARFFAVKNNSSGGNKVTVKTPSGSGIAVASADGYVLLYCDGTNVIQISAAVGGGGGSLPNFADEETPGGTIDGANAAFTLAHAPSPAASLQLFLNGQLLKPGGVDYTLSGLNITMTNPPAGGDIPLAWYRY